MYKRQGFDKAPAQQELPKMQSVQADQGARAVTAPEPVPLKEVDVPKVEDETDDVFDDILKIFNKRD